MSNVIQHYSFKDISSYGKSIKLNTSIQELNRRQKEIRKSSTCHIVSRDDAATVEISELARTLYQTSPNVAKKEQPAEDARADAEKYKDLSNQECEIKELEDYIAGHQPDGSVDLLRKDSLVQQAGRNAAPLVDEGLIRAEKEYTQTLSAAADGFADFSQKITYGDYRGNDVSEKDLNFDALDQMENIYQSYKQQIETSYEGDERAKYLSKLDDVYNAVFAEKVIDPVKSAFDDKFTFFQPDSEESTSTIKGTFESMDSFQNYLSSYMTNQEINKRQTAALTEGTKAFYHMADDTSLWHNMDAVKDILNDSMKAYASVKEVTSGSGDYLSAKEAADKIAKSISDKYAQSLQYKYGMRDLEDADKEIKNTKDAKWDEFFKNSIASAQSGMITVNFSFAQLAGLSAEN